MTTLYGWTQQLPNWTILKDKQDTIIIYNFTKPELINLRVYVTGLEQNTKLYEIDKKRLIKKDEIIKIQQDQILNKDTIISYKESIIFQNKLITEELNRQLTKEMQLRLAAQKRASRMYYWFGSGGAIGFILGLLLLK